MILYVPTNKNEMKHMLVPAFDPMNMSAFEVEPKPHFVSFHRDV